MQPEDIETRKIGQCKNCDYAKRIAVPSRRYCIIENEIKDGDYGCWHWRKEGDID